MEMNKLYCGDCLIGMKELPDNSVDCVITDPPYNINLTPQRQLTQPIENDNMTPEEFKKFLNDVFTEVDRVLKDNTFAVVFLGWSTIPQFREVLDKKWTLKAMPIWVKNNFGIGYYTRPQYEPCLLYMKGEPKPLENAMPDVMHFNKILKPFHSCEKPVALLRHLVKHFTKEGDVILDPFAGTGPTLVAAKELGRKYIGFELEQQYVDVCNERLKQEGLNEWF